MGVLGFVIGLLVVATGAAEIKGDNALPRAFVLAVLAGLFYVLVRIRRSLQQQLAALIGEPDRTGSRP